MVRLFFKFPAESFALCNESEVTTCGTGWRKGYGCGATEVRLDVGIGWISGQIIPFMGIVPQVVKFFTAVTVMDIAPILVNKSLATGIQVRDVDVTVDGGGGILED